MHHRRDRLHFLEGFSSIIESPVPADRSMELDACCYADCFDISGPAHLMRKADDGSSRIIPIDWEDKEHCRCVAACLVNGTYIIEQERAATAAGCRPRQQLALPWWESFHFKLAAELKDEEDDDTFGAIFEHAPPPGTMSSAPRYVVAFRGTMPTNPGDLYHDWKVVANSLPDTNRFHRAHEAVSRLLLAAGDGTGAGPVVWLTGHSLGASMALEVGRAMMSEQGLNLRTILFNPPQVSWEPVLNMLPLREEMKRKLAVAGKATKAVAAMILTTDSDAARVEELYRRLSRWTPELYVHEDDPICQGFIGYFERRREAAAAEAQSFSLRGMLSSAVHGKEKKQPPPRVLPSATLWRTRSEPSSDVLRAHGIRQWWKQDAELKLISRQYSCP